MVAASKTLFFAFLAISAQATGHHQHASHHARALAHHAHHAANHGIRDMGLAETEAIKKRMAAAVSAASGRVTKRHEENKNRLKKRAARCRPKGVKGLSNTSPKPSDVGNKDDNKKNDNKDGGTKNDNKDNNKDNNKDGGKQDGGNQGGGNQGGGKKDDNKDNNPPPPPPPPPKHHPGNTLAGTVVSGGDATFYTPGLNACGGHDQESDFIAAVPFDDFDSYPGATPNPNNNPICQKRVRAEYQGRSCIVRVVDKCAGCHIHGSLDLSPPAFKQLVGDLGVGRVHNIKYTWLD